MSEQRSQTAQLSSPNVFPKTLIGQRRSVVPWTTPKRFIGPVVPASHSSNHLVTVRIDQAIGPAQLSGFLASDLVTPAATGAQRRCQQRTSCILNSSKLSPNENLVVCIQEFHEPEIGFWWFVDVSFFQALLSASISTPAILGRKLCAQAATTHLE